MKLFIPTCDSHQWVLNITIPLLRKYVTDEGYILGFNKEQDFEGFEFISLYTEQDPSIWSMYLHSYLATLPDKHIIFWLDDFFPLSPLNKAVFNPTIAKMEEDNTIGRYEFGKSSRLSTLDGQNGNIITYSQSSGYRVSCQPSVWRLDYLCKFLKEPATPWLFELKGSQKAKADMNKIIITDPQAINYNIMGGLSSQWENQLSISELKGEDLELAESVAKEYKHTLIRI